MFTRADRVLHIRHDGQITRIASSPALKNILLYSNYDLQYKPNPARAARRDASWSSRNVARVAMDACGVRLASVSQATRSRAYGEIVWFWRRDRGVYSRRPVLAGQR